MEASKRIKRLVEEQKDSELLPGIPHDITLCVVIPNLSWRDLRTLFSVSPIWRQEIQSRHVYEERRRTQSTEDLAVISHYYPLESEYRADHNYEDIHVLTLYSVRDKCCYNLPTIPFPGGIRTGSRFIALDGEIYILGGRTPVGASREVYVLDVAGQQTEWKQCASMHEPRRDFGVCVLNGKIYVSGGGGSSNPEPVLACEVYDPKLNTWSSTAPMTEGRIFHTVAVMGKDLLVYGGNSLAPVPAPVIYHPRKNEWRQMKSPDFTSTLLNTDIFMAGGDFYAIDGFTMKVYKYSDEGLWNFEQSCEDIRSLGSRYESKLTIALGDELLVATYNYEALGFRPLVGTGVCLYQSTGFCKDANIVWEKANCSPNTFGKFGFVSLKEPFLCSIQL